jgi:hypothetical protein
MAYRLQTKMAELVKYIADRYPGIVLQKKWNRLLRDISKEIEFMESLIEEKSEETKDKDED